MLACRRLRAGENVRGSVGLPMPGTQVRVVHPDTRADLADGEQARSRAWIVGFRVGFKLLASAWACPCRARRSAWCTPTRAPTWPTASRRVRRLARVVTPFVVVSRVGVYTRRLPRL